MSELNTMLVSTVCGINYVMIREYLKISYISQLNNNHGAAPRHRTSTANISVKDVFAEPNGGQINRAYETSLGDDDDINSMRLQPRQNQVTFQGRY